MKENFFESWLHYNKKGMNIMPVWKRNLIICFLTGFSVNIYMLIFHYKDGIKKLTL